jgi:uncharacterized protein YqfB (UPF0267 family)
MKNNTIGLLTLCLLFAACSNQHRKITVFTKGSTQVDAGTQTVTVKDESGNEDNTFDYNGVKAVHVKTTDKTASIEIPTSGYYVVNGKNDTIIGSVQNYSVPKSTETVTSQESLKRDIDSLEQLVQGKGLTKNNFFLLPFTAAKVTDNIDAVFVAPYHQMSSIEKTADDKIPEVYRFWSIKDVRATIEHLKGMTIFKQPGEEKKP